MTIRSDGDPTPKNGAGKSRRNHPPSCMIYPEKAKAIEIDTQESIRSVAFLADGKHIVSGGVAGKIRRWRVKDGKPMGKPLHVGSTISNIVVSQDGKWVVGGTNVGRLAVWRKGYKKPLVFSTHAEWIRAVDMSPDATRIMTGSYDRDLCVWSPPVKKQWIHPLLGPLRHDWSLAAVKFSPDGYLIATATWCRSSIRIYDSQHGRLLVNFPVQVSSSENQSLAWASDSKRLFALSRDGKIHCLDVHSGTILSQWSIHSPTNSRCITLACDGRLIAASAGCSVSFWDTGTHRQVGFVIEHPALIVSMAISTNYDIVLAGGNKITLRNVCEVLPASYYEGRFLNRPGVAQRLKMLILRKPANHYGYKTVAQAKISNLEKSIQELHREPKLAVDWEDALDSKIGIPFDEYLFTEQ